MAIQAVVSMGVPSTCWGATRGCDTEGAVTREQLALQLRTGLKGMGMSFGTTLNSTAPVWPSASSRATVRAAVCTAQSTIHTRNRHTLAVLLPTCRRPSARPLVAETSRGSAIPPLSCFEKTLVVSAGVFAVIVACGPSFIELWTAGRLQSSTGLFLSAACAAGDYDSPERDALRAHRYQPPQKAAVAEMINGALAMVFCWAAVRSPWCGLGRGGRPTGGPRLQHVVVAS